jgi:tubulin-specific chaperone D
VPFFPHQVEDLTICLEYTQRLQRDPLIISPAAQMWSMRYVLLLWLWLICRIPFDLSNFDSDPTRPGQTAAAIEAVGRNTMDKSGIERDGAALLLARLYTRYIADYLVHLAFILLRQDSCSLFPEFLSWSSEYIRGLPSIFSVSDSGKPF